MALDFGDTYDWKSYQSVVASSGSYLGLLFIAMNERTNDVNYDTPQCYIRGSTQTKNT